MEYNALQITIVRTLISKLYKLDVAQNEGRPDVDFLGYTDEDIQRGVVRRHPSDPSHGSLQKKKYNHVIMVVINLSMYENHIPVCKNNVEAWV